jgi:hypothetical protein
MPITTSSQTNNIQLYITASPLWGSLTNIAGLHNINAIISIARTHYFDTSVSRAASASLYIHMPSHTSRYIDTPPRCASIRVFQTFIVVGLLWFKIVLRKKTSITYLGKIMLFCLPPYNHTNEYNVPIYIYVIIFTSNFHTQKNPGKSFSLHDTFYKQLV